MSDVGGARGGVGAGTCACRGVDGWWECVYRDSVVYMESGKRIFGLIWQGMTVLNGLIVAVKDGVGHGVQRVV
jgi:hypothetical protein